MNIDEAIQRLARAGGSFVISVPWIDGVRTVPVAPAQAARLVDAPTTVHAEVAGLSEVEYIEWKASGGSVLCRSSTVHGNECATVAKPVPVPASGSWPRIVRYTRQSATDATA